MALSDTKIERALRKTVGHFYAEERYDDLTVKRVRAAAAEELGLDEGWFKAHEDWNARSKEVINSEVVSSIFSSHPSIPSRCSAHQCFAAIIPTCDPSSIVFRVLVAKH